MFFKPTLENAGGNMIFSYFDNNCVGVKVLLLLSEGDLHVVLVLDCPE